MKFEVMDTLQPSELDATIKAMGFPRPEKWKRVDCGKIECYVGDDVYVIAVVEVQPADSLELKANQEKTERTVIKYLQGEGFLGKEYAYIGLQHFDLSKPFPPFDEE